MVVVAISSSPTSVVSIFRDGVHHGRSNLSLGDNYVHDELTSKDAHYRSEQNVSKEGTATTTPTTISSVEPQLL